MANFLDSTPLSGFFYNPKKDDQAALAGLNKGTQAYDELVPPSYDPVNYVGPQEAQDIRVDPAALERVGPTAMNDVSVDPRYKDQQLAQLSALAELRDKGGLNLTDKANLQGIQNDEAAASQAQRASVMQHAQMRGTGGSNMAIMDMLNANQGSANRQSQRDMQIAGMAQDRALQAGNMAASQSAGMSKQDFDQQAQVAAARDTAAKFNAGMANTNNQFNANQNINVQQANQQKNQGVNNATALANNTSQTMNKFTMPTQAFGNSVNKASGTTTAGRNVSDYYSGNKAAGNNQQGGLWGGALGLGMKAYDKFGGSGGAASSGSGGAATSSGGSAAADAAYSGAADSMVGGMFGAGAWKYGTETPAMGMSLTGDTSEEEKQARLAGLKQVGG